MLKGTRHQAGFSLVDLLVTIALVGVVSAMALPMAESSARGFRTRGDAQSMANLVSLAKMRAASRFSRARVRADLGANTYQLEIWDKTANGGAGGWQMEGGPNRLARGVSFGFAGLAVPPLNTQVAIGQSPPCTGMDSLTANFIDGTACIVFNSRGVPVDAAGAPVGGNAFYITDGSGVYATTITATPLVRQWWSGAAVANWVQR